ncbi:phage tail protein [Novosphingobium sp.]|uniref:phage tail protein n=1 Tax=Novosphingobium sp. TaxID=1874826 RepID=UPI0026309DB3|nr:phage tail protein [Novosphingobium sp.]
MASLPTNTLSSGHLLTLGMFLFGIDALAYSELSRRTSWRHALSERFMARPASQYLGPGEDNITLAGRLMPEVSGQFAAIETLKAMADTGDDYPLVDGLGRVLGHFRIVRIEENQIGIMGGGLSRGLDFVIELERVD